MLEVLCQPVLYSFVDVQKSDITVLCSDRPILNNQCAHNCMHMITIDGTDSMAVDALVAQLLRDPKLASGLELLPDATAQFVVEHLKQEADRYWGINANHSVELAEAIIQIGQARHDVSQTALGIMARGDALKLLGRTAEAWQALEEAGNLFLSADNDVGWARTRIGRLLICVDLNHVSQALADAERAQAIFSQHGEQEKHLRLELNIAIVYDLLGEHAQALALYQAALIHAYALGAAGAAYLGALYTNIGLTYEALGDFQRSALHHEKARAFFIERNQPSAIAITESNLAHIAMTQGRYRHALKLLHHAHGLRITERLFRDAARISCDIIECYLLLNRYIDARDLAYKLIDIHRAFHSTYLEAMSLLHLATAEAEAGNLEAAQVALDAAEPIFTALGATSWVTTTHLRRGRIALEQGHINDALRAARSTAAHYAATGQDVNYAAAMLLQGQASFAAGDLQTAENAALVALRIAQRCNVPPLRYASHLLLGRTAEAHGALSTAIRRYQAAAATVDRVQRSLTITLRPGFLEDKGEALRALLMLYLRGGHVAAAWEALERAKGQVLLGYLANREQLRWANDEDDSRTLVEELNQLRAEHQSFYHIAHAEPSVATDGPRAMSPAQALSEVNSRERRMRAITEQLYLRGGEEGYQRHRQMPSLLDIQQHLDGTLLIEFYHDGIDFWAWTLDRDRLNLHCLPAPSEMITSLLAQLEINLAAALQLGPNGPAVRALSRSARRIAQRLYQLLLEPFAALLPGHRRLTIVPYGPLHYLPFHLLHTGASYLIELYEIVILPAAALLSQPSPQCTGGALVLAHSREGCLPQTLLEGQSVQRLFGGEIRSEGAADRSALQVPPRQILHIAAHGEHRLDNPDLSYIELADGQLYTDDLLQQDMRYELVTLSACETGRAKVALSDELIGLGRGFLYAGAGALIVSLWRIVDARVVVFMEQLYSALYQGASKAAALQAVQRSLLAAEPDLHPAFWGAFQLIGDAGPLSGTGST